MYRRNPDMRPIDIELQDLETGNDFHSVPINRPDPLGIGADVYREKEAQHKRDCRKILFLALLAASLTILSMVFGFLYDFQRTQPPDIKNLTTIASTTESFTEFLIQLTTTTAISLQPTTETVFSTIVSTQTETTTRRAKTSSVTAIITTTLYLTSTQTSSEIASSNTASSASSRCIPPGLYGGEELHQLSSDYDVLITSNLKYATSHGLSIGNQDPYLVALRSIFACVAEEDLLLAMACETGYVRTDSAIACDGAVYAPPSSQVSISTTTWTVSATLPEVIPITTDNSSVTPVTETKTTDVVLTWSPGATGSS